MKYFIRLSYNGAPFSGWQIQKKRKQRSGGTSKGFLHSPKRED
jgi:hypothetical protein